MSTFQYPRAAVKSDGASPRTPRRKTDGEIESRDPIASSPRAPLEEDDAQRSRRERGKTLYKAVKRGEDLADPAVLRKEVEVDFRGAFSDTPLMTACARGNLREVHTLMAAGAAVTAADKFGCTPLHYAARAGHVPIIKWLLNAAADPHATNKQGKTPLQVAHTDVQIFLHALAKASSPEMDEVVSRPLPERRVAEPIAMQQPVASVRRPPVERTPQAAATARPSRAVSKPASDVKGGAGTGSLSARDIPTPAWSLRLTQPPERFSAPAPVEDKLLEIGSLVRLPEISPRMRDARVKSTYGVALTLGQAPLESALDQAEAPQSEERTNDERRRRESMLVNSG